MPANGHLGACMRRCVLGMVVLGVTGVLLTSGPARACTYWRGVSAVMPQPDASGVPRNARIWLEDSSGDARVEETLRLTVPEGPDVPFAVARVLLPLENGAPLLVLTPVDLLPASTTVAVIRAEDPRQAALELFRFDVGTAEDNDTPDLPRELSRRPVVYPPSALGGDTCGYGGETLHGMQFQFAPFGGSLLLLNLNDTASLQADTMAGVVHGTLGAESAVLLLSYRGGPQDTDSVRFGLVDVAGNFSGWGASSTIGKVNRCACAQVGPHPTFSGVALWMAVVALLRRSRRRAAS